MLVLLPALVCLHADLSQGIDLARLADKQQFAFVDGLSELFSSPQSSIAPGASHAEPMAHATLPLLSQPGTVSGRGPPSASSTRGNNIPRDQQEPGVAKKLHFSERGIAALDALARDIISVIGQLKSSGETSDETLLIIDQPDFVLAATGQAMGIGATEMAEWVTGLQQVSSLSREAAHRLTVRSMYMQRC